MKQVQRIQTGVRVERRIVQVLKAIAERLDMSLGELIEGIALHSFEGKNPFSAETLRQIAQLKSVYGLDLDSSDAHRMSE